MNYKIWLSTVNISFSYEHGRSLLSGSGFFFKAAVALTSMHAISYILPTDSWTSLDVVFEDTLHI